MSAATTPRQQIVEQAPKGFQWEVLPPLKGTGTKQAANPQTLSVPAEGKHIEQSAKFIDYFMKAENLAAVGQGDWLIPTTQAARDAIQKATGGKNGWDADAGQRHRPDQGAVPERRELPEVEGPDRHAGAAGVPGEQDRPGDPGQETERLDGVRSTSDAGG